MGHLTIGLVLLGLALFLVLVMFAGSGDITRPITGGADPLGDWRDTHVVIPGREKPSGPPPARANEVPLGARHDGVLTREERRRIDRRGFLEYRALDGDSLRALSRTYLGKENLWREVLAHNPHLMHSKDLRPGVKIRIPLWLREDW